MERVYFNEFGAMTQHNVWNEELGKEERVEIPPEVNEEAKAAERAHMLADIRKRIKQGGTFYDTYRPNNPNQSEESDNQASPGNGNGFLARIRRWLSR